MGILTKLDNGTYYISYFKWPNLSLDSVYLRAGKCCELEGFNVLPIVLGTLCGKKKKNLLNECMKVTEQLDFDKSKDALSEDTDYKCFVS